MSWQSSPLPYWLKLTHQEPFPVWLVKLAAILTRGVLQQPLLVALAPSSLSSNFAHQQALLVVLSFRCSAYASGLRPGGINLLHKSGTPAAPAGRATSPMQCKRQQPLLVVFLVLFVQLPAIHPYSSPKGFAS